MEKIININLKKAEDITNKYNDNVIKSELLSYLLDSAKYIKRKDKIKILIDNNTNLESNNIKKLIILGLKEEYTDSIRHHSINNFKEIIFLIVGILLLYISSYFDNNIGRELFLIGGWVFIWETIELEVIYDNREKRKRFLLKRLMNSVFVIK